MAPKFFDPNSFWIRTGSIVEGEFLTETQSTRVEMRTIGSLLLGSARSSCSAIHNDSVAPAELPDRTTFDGSMFHSAALDRTNWTTRAPSSIGAGSMACWLNRQL